MGQSSWSQNENVPLSSKDARYEVTYFTDTYVKNDVFFRLFAKFFVLVTGATSSSEGSWHNTRTYTKFVESIHSMIPTAAIIQHDYTATKKVLNLIYCKS